MSNNFRFQDSNFKSHLVPRTSYLKPRVSGFSLVELLVVIAIMAILAGGIGLSLAHLPGQAKVKRAKSDLSILKVALQTYRADHDYYPTEEQGLAALCYAPTREPVPQDYPQGGYLDSLDVPKDPWKREYVYFMPGREGKPFEVVTYGRDGEPGGEGPDADISSLEL